jgi:iron complex outermembrane receptor protein
MIKYGYIFLLVPISLFAQQPQTGRSVTDTIQLEEVTVRGYETNRPLLETSASVNVLSAKELTQRFGTPALVPALNTLPGVRMDERSPGSYRLSIRGSLIRSPFGVRNVKIYWNELPLTDAAEPRI